MTTNLTALVRVAMTKIAPAKVEARLPAASTIANREDIPCREESPRFHITGLALVARRGCSMVDHPWVRRG